MDTKEASKDSLKKEKKKILQTAEIKAENAITGYITLCNSVSANVRWQTQLLFLATARSILLVSTFHLTSVGFTY